MTDETRLVTFSAALRGGVSGPSGWFRTDRGCLRSFWPAEDPLKRSQRSQKILSITFFLYQSRQIWLRQFELPRVVGNVGNDFGAQNRRGLVTPLAGHLTDDPRLDLGILCSHDDPRGIVPARASMVQEENLLAIRDFEHWLQVAKRVE